MKTIALVFSVCSFFCGSVFSQTAISGVWLLNGPGTESAIQLTPLGEQIRTDYDLLVDDPSLSCTCLLYTSPSPRDQRGSRMPSSA